MAGVPINDSFKLIFWDIDINNLDPDKHRRQIIERILNYGDEHTYRWMFAVYSKETIAQEVKRNRNIDKRAATMMANYYDLPREEIACLTTV